VAGLHSASSALYVSDIPITQAVAGVRIGRLGGDILINPTLKEQENSTLDLLVVGSGSRMFNDLRCVVNSFQRLGRKRTSLGGTWRVEVGKDWHSLGLLILPIGQKLGHSSQGPTTGSS